MLPHMHLVGKEMKLTATLPDGTVQPLIWIDDWNFYAQDNYVFHEPVRLPRGTRLDVLSRYDNTAENPLNPSKPPQRVFFGNGSTDEMCFAIFQIIVDHPGEEMRMQGALMQTMMRDWNTSKIDPVARDKIVLEAGKLFGGGPDLFKSLLGRGARPDRGADPKTPSPAP